MENREIALHKKQFQALQSKKQYTFCICGHRAGKSFVGAVWSGLQIQKFPKGTGAIIAPTYPLLRQATLDTFFKVLPEYRKYYKEHKSVIELPTGGQVYIRSADEPLGLEGMTLDWCWGDECGMWKRLAWDIIRARLSTTSGQFFGTSTPYALNFMFEDVYTPWKEGKDDAIEVIQWKSVENPYFPQEFAEAERKRLSPQEFSRRYEGEFTKMQGLVFDLPREHILQWNDEWQIKLGNSEITIAGIDWGFRNPTAISVWKLKDNVWYLVDEYYEAEQTTQDIIESAKQIQDQWGVNRWYADYAEPDRIEEFRRANFPVIESNKDRDGAITLVRGYINERRLFAFSHCTNFIDEINYYHYGEVKEGVNSKEEPVKDRDHLMDSMMYALNTYIPQIYTPRYDSVNMTVSW